MCTSQVHKKLTEGKPTVIFMIMRTNKQKTLINKKLSVKTFLYGFGTHAPLDTCAD